ncbi:unnamed protein product [Ranitomeya imitator]|uniref:Uncharacterized protein n=1 Tax=Ranitomeya imitator TaxID=111125 RepID=A0ABN9MK41_9NEOB|nr:unnamed protein product [Ranitomeya imitator]
MADIEKDDRPWVGVVRRIVTFTFAFLVLAGMSFKIMAFGIYGAFLSAHLIIQSFFCLFGAQEDEKKWSTLLIYQIGGLDNICLPGRSCLFTRVPRVCQKTEYPPDKLQIIMIIDGNSPEDRYMMDMFKEVFSKEDVGTYEWKNNYHHWDKDTAEKKIYGHTDMMPPEELYQNDIYAEVREDNFV